MQSLIGDSGRDLEDQNTDMHVDIKVMLMQFQMEMRTLLKIRL